MKLSTTTTLFASLACLVSASTFASASAPPKASVQASIATAGNRALLALDNAKKAVSTFTDRVQATTNSLDIDPAVKEEFNTRFIILNRELEHSIFRVEGLVERFGSIHMKDDGETLRLNQDDSELPRINQDTPSRKLAKSRKLARIEDRIDAIYDEYFDFDDMPEATQTELNALWQDFVEQTSSPPLGSNGGRVHISSKSRTEDKPAKSDEVLSLLGKIKKQVFDRTFVFRGGDVLSKDELARVQKRAEELRKRYVEVRKRYDEGWKRAREGRKKTDEDRKSRQFEL